MVCKGRKVDPCEGRFYSKFKKKSRPTDCIDKLYKESVVVIKVNYIEKI